MNAYARSMLIACILITMMSIVRHDQQSVSTFWAAALVIFALAPRKDQE